MGILNFSALISLFAGLFGGGQGIAVDNLFQFSAMPESRMIVREVKMDKITQRPLVDLLPGGEDEPQSAEEPLIIEGDSFIDHQVSFTSQAPFGVWDALHGETCEEASMVMAVYHFRNQAITPHTADQEFLKLVAWEESKGYTIDLTAKETVDVLRDYFDYTDVKLFGDVTADAIKRELDAGNLVIIPAAGRELGNPYFTPPGPIYHMLVIRGYDDKTQQFITNDPGTRRGEGFRYGYSQLIAAIHDWNHDRAVGGMTDAEMAQGRKVFISVSPEK